MIRLCGQTQLDAFIADGPLGEGWQEAQEESGMNDLDDEPATQRVHFRSPIRVDTALSKRIVAPGLSEPLFEVIFVECIRHHDEALVPLTARHGPPRRERCQRTCQPNRGTRDLPRGRAWRQWLLIHRGIGYSITTVTGREIEKRNGHT